MCGNHFFVVSFFLLEPALFIGSVALLVTRPWEGVVCVWRLHLFIIMAVAICAIASLFHKQALGLPRVPPKYPPASLHLARLLLAS
jgi:hypothetical protein